MTFPSASQSSTSGKVNWRNAKTAAAFIGVFIVSIWVIEIVDTVLPLNMDQWGIIGWEFTGFFPGLFLAPLLHAGFGHLLSNTVTFAVLGFLAAAKGMKPFLTATLIILLVHGIGVWLTSPGVSTVGASGLIFGYFGYLIGRGVLHRNLWDIFIAVCVIIVYGSLVFGILPSNPSVSWQGHLFGLVGGVIAAWLMRPKKSKPADATDSSIPNLNL